MSSIHPSPPPLRHGLAHDSRSNPAPRVTCTRRLRQIGSERNGNESRINRQTKSIHLSRARGARAPRARRPRPAPMVSSSSSSNRLWASPCSVCVSSTGARRWPRDSRRARRLLLHHRRRHQAPRRRRSPSLQQAPIIISRRRAQPTRRPRCSPAAALQPRPPRAINHSDRRRSVSMHSRRALARSLARLLARSTRNFSPREQASARLAASQPASRPAGLPNPYLTRASPFVFVRPSVKP